MRTEHLAQALEEVPDLVAAHVMHHVREMYPQMFAAAPKMAQTSLRNCVVRECERFIKAAVAAAERIDTQR